MGWAGVPASYRKRQRRNMLQSGRRLAPAAHRVNFVLDCAGGRKFHRRRIPRILAHRTIGNGSGQFAVRLYKGTPPGLEMHLPSIETKESWTVATAALVAILMTFGAGWITPVAFKDIAAEANGTASV